MRTTTFTVFGMFLALTTAPAQQTQSDSSTKAQATTPIAGIDDAVLARSARASKLIGSTVYTSDTSIGQIEDVLVDLDHATVAQATLPEMAKDELPDGDQRVFMVSVRDEAGQVIMRAALTLTVEYPLQAEE
jgi:sporulation protein YlmC with PRC-barrel domain